MKNGTLQPWHLLLTILAGIVNREQQRGIEYLRTENLVEPWAEISPMI
jgi:hypothetical protein